ncbi:MAG: copper amine oxidase N-terminal domain-containing protein [Chloroflexi bacterium]|nr:copper amine oxidase N-terminal domain-containing protein [Chloroflexota bacterium]
MTKTFAFTLAIILVLTLVPSALAEEDTVSPNSLISSILSDEPEDLTPEGVIAIEGEEELKADEDTVVEKLDSFREISRKDLAKLLGGLYIYLLKRDLYYRQVLHTLDRISKLNRPELKKQAIIEFEKRYYREKEKDRKVHHKIEQVLNFIKEHKNQFNPEERQAISKFFDVLVPKYFKHRRIIIHIHQRIEALKEAALKVDLEQLSALARQQRGKGRMQQAKELYEQLLEKGLGNASLYREAGEVLQKVEGKGPKVFVRGKRPAFDVNPQIINGRTMVPFRAIANALGVDNNGIIWDPNTRTVTIKKGGRVVELPVGDVNVRVNGKVIRQTVAAAVVNGRTLVPVRTVSEALEAKVDYDPKTEVVTIEDLFGTESQTLYASEFAETGLAAVDSALAGLSEQVVVDEVSSADDSTVQEAVDALGVSTPGEWSIFSPGEWSIQQ